MRKAVVLMIAVVAATSAFAGQNGRGPKGHKEPQSRESSRVELSVGPAGFNVSVQQTIRGYYAGKPKVRRGGLPPGVAKQYARGKALPPGIAKRRLPLELQARLPVHRGYDYVIVDRDVLLVSIRTGIVADIIIDVM